MRYSTNFEVKKFQLKYNNRRIVISSNYSTFWTQRYFWLKLMIKLICRLYTHFSTHYPPRLLYQSQSSTNDLFISIFLA